MNKFLRNLKINIAMAAILLIFATLIGVVAALGLIASRTAGESLDLIERVSIVQVDQITDAEGLLNSARIKLDLAASNLLKDLTAQAERQMAKAAEELKQSQARIDSFLAAPKSERVQELSDEIERYYVEVMELVWEQHGALEAGDTEDFDIVRQMLVPSSDGLEESTEQFIAYADERRAEQLDAYKAQVQRFSRIGVGVLSFTLGMIALISLGLSKLVIRPIRSAVESLQQIAGADLSHEIEVPGNNEIGQLFAAMRHMQQSLVKIVTDVRDSSNSIYIGATEIAGGNNDLSSRTEQQAASLEETATSMEQLTATVKQNADNARQASGLANEASGTATRGGEVVDQVVDTMQGISDSSRKIADITGMIDSIAFQTNLLALNASVEAARAGEHGRGFAVVAGEVRNLAGSSADAAQEIKQLIENSSSQVEQGSRLVAQAGETMQEVVAAVKRVTDIMDEISAASQEQSGGIDQVSQAVSQMDEVTQQNATLVQEAAAAAGSLEDQARRLEQAVAIFRLMDSQVSESSKAPESSPLVPFDESGEAANEAEPRAGGVALAGAAVAGGEVVVPRDSSEGDWEEF